MYTPEVRVDTSTVPPFVVETNFPSKERTDTDAISSEVAVTFNTSVAGLGNTLKEISPAFPTLSVPRRKMSALLSGSESLVSPAAVRAAESEAAEAEAGTGTGTGTRTRTRQHRYTLVRT